MIEVTEEEFNKVVNHFVEKEGYKIYFRNRYFHLLNDKDESVAIRVHYTGISDEYRLNDECKSYYKDNLVHIEKDNKNHEVFGRYNIKNHDKYTHCKVCIEKYDRHEDNQYVILFFNHHSYVNSILTDNPISELEQIGSID